MPDGLVDVHAIEQVVADEHLLGDGEWTIGELGLRAPNPNVVALETPCSGPCRTSTPACRRLAFTSSHSGNSAHRSARSASSTSGA